MANCHALTPSPNHPSLYNLYCCVFPRCGRQWHRFGSARCTINQQTSRSSSRAITMATHTTSTGRAECWPTPSRLERISLVTRTSMTVKTGSFAIRTVSSNIFDQILSNGLSQLSGLKNPLPQLNRLRLILSRSHRTVTCDHFATRIMGGRKKIASCDKMVANWCLVIADLLVIILAVN